MTSSPAFECALSLRGSDTGSLCPASSLIWSTLRMILQCARFVEERARDDPSLGVLSLAIIAKTKTGSDSSAKVFKLWGPKFPSTVTVPDSSTASAGNPVLSQDAHGQGEGGKTNQSRSSTSMHYGANCGIGAGEDNCRPKPNGPSESESHTTLTSPAVDTIQQCFQIEDRFTARCLSLLLDASGITSHPSIFIHRTLASIPGPVLISAVRSVMDAYKTKNEVSSKFLKYSSLLPRELRDRRVRYSSLALVRNAIGYRVLNAEQTIVLSVKKPDRNRKEVHFAMLAALLQVDPNGVCNSELEKLSLQGMGPTGCTRKNGQDCGGPASCIERRVKPLCEFIDESNSIVSTGEVYPSIPYYRGCAVPPEKLVVRFSTSQTPADADAQNGFRIWNKCMISRTDLLDAFSNVVGSAILAVDKVQEDNWRAGACGNVDFAEAVVFCDIQIHLQHKSDAYCFSEWSRFGLSSIQDDTELAPSQSNICRTLGDFENHASGFWHRKFMKERN